MKRKKVITKASEGSKIKTTVRIDHKLIELLRKESDRTGHPHGYIIEFALGEYFNPNKEDDRMAAISRRLLNVDKGIGNLDDAMKIISELLVVFLKTWFLHNPELPENTKKSITPQMLRRYERVFQILAKNIAEEKTIFDLLPGTIKKLKAEDFSKVTASNIADSQEV